MFTTNLRSHYECVYVNNSNEPRPPLLGNEQTRNSALTQAHTPKNNDRFLFKTRSLILVLSLSQPVFVVTKEASHFFPTRVKRRADASLQPSQSLVHFHRSRQSLLIQRRDDHTTVVHISQSNYRKASLRSAELRILL